MPRYALVGCTNDRCRWLWITGTRSDSATCPRCGTQFALDSLKRLAASDDRGEVVDARTARLEARSGSG